MSENEWPEVTQALNEKRYELGLSGPEISERLQKSALDPRLFKILELNFLEISNTTLQELPDELQQLINLKNLALQGNKLKSIPAAISGLKSLTFLDISNNELESLVDSIASCTSLHSLNVSSNKITHFPDIGTLKNLAILHLDNNELTALPDGLFHLQHLSELYASKNRIVELAEEVGNLKALKVLDLSENSLKDVPGQLAECTKLKDLKLQDNPLKDNRLKKMAVQCSTKAVISYLVQHSSSAKGKGKKGKKKKGKEDKDDEDSDDNTRKIYVQYNNDQKTTVTRKNVLKDIRPYIVCVLIKSLDLSDPSAFRKFISLQTKLHEQLCEFRTVATIATHNLEHISLPLVYDAIPPDTLTITPLGKQEALSAKQLMANLHDEKEKEKEKKKRQVKTGLYRYLDLMDGHELYACVKDNSGKAVSFPPITNSEDSKVSSTIADVFVEVTSSVSLPKCKIVMEAFVHELYNGGFVSKELQGEGVTPCNGLILEQVRIQDEDGGLLSVFPSNVDLDLGDSVIVKRQ